MNANVVDPKNNRLRALKYRPSKAFGIFRKESLAV